MTISKGLEAKYKFALVVVVAATVVAACSSSKSSNSAAPTSAAAPTASASTAATSAAASAVATASAVASAASSPAAAASSGGSGDLAAIAAADEQMPTTVKSTAFGPFKPKAGGYFYYVSCDLSIVGCHQIANGVQAGTEALGYKYTVCDAGTTSTQANACFTNAINAKPSVILVGGDGVSVAGAGYAAAKKAGIPLVGVFTSNPAGTTNAEVADTVCTGEGATMADAIVADSKGQADVLYVGETSQACDAARNNSFGPEFKKDCPTCTYTYLGFDYPTIQQTLPRQIQTAIIHDPKITWIVGVFDQAASIAVTQVQQAGKTSSISVAGMDGNPPNVQLIRQGQVQKFDLAVGQGEDGWTAADAAARIYSGLTVPFNVPVNTFLITPANVSQVDSGTNTWPGPNNYQQLFKTLWGMS